MGGCCAKRALTTTHIQTESLHIKDLMTLLPECKEFSTQINEDFNNQYSLVYTELTCQVCQEKLKKPITLPCLTHSVCSLCALNLWKNWLKGGRFLICPTCGESGGKMSVKNGEGIKTNSELENIMLAYESERNLWYLEKKRLEDLINSHGLDKNNHEEFDTQAIQISLEKFNQSQLISFIANILGHLSKNKLIGIDDIKSYMDGINVVDVTNNSDNNGLSGTSKGEHTIEPITQTKNLEKIKNSSQDMKRKRFNSNKESTTNINKDHIIHKYIKKKIRKNIDILKSHKHTSRPSSPPCH